MFSDCEASLKPHPPKWELISRLERIKYMKQKRTIAILFFALLFCLLPAVASAQSAEAVTITTRVGFDNYYSENQWIPVHITVSNDGPAIDGYIEIARSGFGSTGTRNYRTPAILPTQSKKQFTLYVFPENFINTLQIRLRDNDDKIIQSVSHTGVRSIVPGDILYGVVSDEDVNLDVLETVKVELVPGDSHDANVAYLGLDDLPEVSAAWQGLDVLVFSHFDSNKLTPNQRDQIRTWVETGGQLVVMGGVGAQQTAAAFEEILPVTVGNNKTVESLSELGRNLSIDLEQSGNYLLTDTQLKKGEVLLSNDAQPVLARTPLGSGHVSYIAFDSELEPLQNSRVAQALWQQVAVTTGQPVLWENGWINMYSAEEAARVFPELSPPSVLGLGGFLLLYILTIGPVNYMVLKRLERRELAWFTIPAIIALFLGVAYVTGFQWRGSDVLVNQLSVSIGSADSDTVKVDSVIGVYSPRRGNYDIAFEDDALVRIGGNDFRGGGNSTNSTSRSYIERGGENLVRDFRINIADAQSLRATTYRPAPAIDGTVTFDADARSIEVDIFNDSDIDLKDVSIFLGTVAINLPDIGAGRRINETQKLTISEGQVFERVTNSQADEPSSVVPVSVNNTTGRELAVNELVPGDRWGFDQSAENYMRYQFIESVMPMWHEPGSNDLYIPRGSVALVAWSDEQPVQMDVKDASSRITGTTLHIIEIPAEAQ